MTKIEIIAVLRESYSLDEENMCRKISCDDCYDFLPDIYNYCESLMSKSNNDTNGLIDSMIIKHYIKNPIDKLKALLNDE